MRRAFITWEPRGQAARDLMNECIAIAEDYSRQGYDLTVRQLYYQLVSRDRIANTDKSYKRIIGLVDSARLGGHLDWSYIVDRTRNAYRTDGLDTSPEDAIRSTAGGYSRALWETQPNHVEVWVEKEALSGVVASAARQVGVTYFACRGYVSQSEMYAAGMRFLRNGRDGKAGHIIHLGDHDPSGIDMTRDIRDRLTMFAGPYAPTVNRVALNMPQIEQYGPPPNFAKVTDSRFAGYQAEYGDDSWELDALPPNVLSDLITSAVLDLRDETLWAEAEEREQEERAQLESVSDRWDDVIELIGQG